MNASTPQPAPTLAPDELIKLCAIDNILFEKTFFPKAARQESAPFHADWWQHLENPKLRYLNLVCFRDSAKTTKLRMYTAKRIAYGLSRTILYIGASEKHAIRSIRWIKARIEEKRGAGGVMRKEQLAQVFDLRQGSKWTDEEIEVFHGLDTTPIWMLGVGVTSTQLRGINFDDFRPDLIVVDDALTDENGATSDQREKLNDTIMGSVKGSLAPASEMPNAKLVMLNTPQAHGDIVELAEQDPEFFTARYSCWTPQTEQLDLDKQQSSWEVRYPTPVRQAEKRAAIKLNRLSTFMKEKEVRIVSKESAVFRPEWLRYWNNPEDIPRHGVTVLFIDPTPPPDEKKGSVAKKKLDFEVIGALKRAQGNYYLLAYDALQGGTPAWTINKFFEYRWQYRPIKAAVETVNYQRTLKWLLEEEMKKRQQWTTIQPFSEIRSKYNRIYSALHKTASDGKLFIHPSMTTFIEQFTAYPAVRFDDHLDGVSIGIHTLNTAGMDFLESEAAENIDNSGIPKLKVRRGCP
jgi:hypothetical protein